MRHNRFCCISIASASNSESFATRCIASCYRGSTVQCVMSDNSKKYESDSTWQTGILTPTDARFSEIY